MNNTTLCRCGRCSRVLRSKDAVEVGYGSYCCKQATGKTIRQILKELQKEAADGTQTE